MSRDRRPGGMSARGVLITVLRPILQPFWRLTRGQTLGVRGVVRDPEGRVLLVRHTYAPGWMFPGGGVERRDTLEDALRREFSEEVGLEIVGSPRLFGVYANFEIFPGDHIALFEIDDWRGEPRRSVEIAEWGFFDPDGLPEGTTEGTRRRLDELIGNADSSTMW